MSFGFGIGFGLSRGGVPTWYYNVINSTKTNDGSYDASGQDGNNQGVAFSNDGSKMYVVGNANDTVYQYSLSTPWVITSGVSLDGSFDVGTAVGETGPRSCRLSPDGTKFYLIGSTNDRIYQWSLTTSNDITGSKTLDGSYLVSGQDALPTEIDFSTDGSKVFMVGFNDIVYQYSLSTPWDVTSTVMLDGSFNVGSPTSETETHALFIKNRKLFIAGTTNATIYQFSLVGFEDVTTGTPTLDGSYDVSSFCTQPSSVYFKTDGSVLYVSDIALDLVFQISLTAP